MKGKAQKSSFGWEGKNRANEEDKINFGPTRSWPMKPVWIPQKANMDMEILNREHKYYWPRKSRLGAAS